MARTRVEERLAEYDRRHRELAAQIAEIGIVAAGSVTRRFTRSRRSAAGATLTRLLLTGPTGSGQRK